MALEFRDSSANGSRGLLYSNLKRKSGDGMASSLYEIVELPDGEFALQRPGEDGEPLVRIEFSEEARVYLRDSGLDVARAMIDAGIEAIENLGTSAGLEGLGMSGRHLLH